MKKILLIFLIFLTPHLWAQEMPGMKMTPGKNESTPPAKKQVYTCVMDPDVHTTKPGKCPKCGMKLVPERPTATRLTPVQDSMKMPANADGMKGAGMGNMKMSGEEPSDQAKKNLGPIHTLASSYAPRTVRYDLYVKDTLVNYGKKARRAIAVNGQIPMPTLTFTEGDTAEIWVHNELNEETTLHWHGLFLPNRYDGVPFLTQMPIKPHASYLYKFPIRQHGTHWYHSHFGLQEQIGMYGAFIMKKRNEWNIPTLPLVLSDWVDMAPKELNRSLHNQTDWFGIRKNTIQSYTEAIHTGNLKTKITNEWKRMLAMDVSDVAYDSFLINGKNKTTHPEFKAGDKVRLRIANGGASSYFWLTYAGGKITVVATDGNDVEPVEVDRLLIAVSETYDVVVTIPENKSYEFLVTPEDRTKSASLWLGAGQQVAATRLPTLKYFAGMKMMNDMMDMRGNVVQMKGMEMANQTMDMNTVMYPEITGEDKNVKSAAGHEATGSKGMSGKSSGSMKGMDMGEAGSDLVTLNYAMLKAPEKTTLPKGPVKTIYFQLTGNMNRYVWSIDNKVVSEADKILIKKGENVRIVLYNNTMMRHPMHLHGHDFRLLNGQGEYSIMKNVIDIMPMERDTLEFAASEQGGDWFFHCHILYHMTSGMGRVFRYKDSLAEKTDIPNSRVARRGLNAGDQHYYAMARVGLESSGSDGIAMLANTRNTLTTTWHLGLHTEHGDESETTIGRYIGRMQWWRPFIGYDYHYKKLSPTGEIIKKGLVARNLFGSEKHTLLGQVSNKDNRSTLTAGVQYLLPMNVLFELRGDLDGKLRFQLMREDIPVSPRFRANFMINTDKEYALGVRYIVTKYFNFSTHYDSDMGYGAGITFIY